MYKSTDAGKTWRHLGLRDGQQIPAILVDPRDPEPPLRRRPRPPLRPQRRSAASSAPPTAARPGRRSSTRTSTPAPSTWPSTRAIPQTVYAVLWQARQGPWENGAFSGPQQRPLQIHRRRHDVEAAHRRPAHLRAGGLGRIGIAIAPERPQSHVRARRSARQTGGALPLRRRGRQLAARQHANSASTAAAAISPASASTRRTRTSSTSPTPPPTAPTDGGQTLHRHQGRARRRRLSHHLDQSATSRDHPARQPIRAPPSPSTAARPGASWYNQPTAQFYHVITDNQFPYWVYGGQQESGSAGVASRGNDGADHLPRLAPGRRRGVRLRRARPARSQHHLRRQGHALQPPHRRSQNDVERRAASIATCAPPRCSSATVDPHVALPRRAEWCSRPPTAARTGTAISPDLSREAYEVPAERGVLRRRREAAGHAPRRRLLPRALAPERRTSSGRAPTTV